MLCDRVEYTGKDFPERLRGSSVTQPVCENDVTMPLLPRISIVGRYSDLK